MPIFLSYSHADSQFATKLATQLVKHKVSVWIDQWEMSVGDSLVEKIQGAIEGASALLVVLTKSSIESAWCKKELSSGLLRELEEKRIVVLPLLVEDCPVPLFLRDKLYADFRANFDTGLRSVLDAVARFASESLRRVDSPEWHTDWSVEWGEREEDQFFMNLTAVQQVTGQPYTVLTEVHIVANDSASARYRALEEAGLDWIDRAAIIDRLCEAIVELDAPFLLEDEKRQSRVVELADTKSPARFHALIESRRLGADTGRSILVRVGALLHTFRKELLSSRRKLTTEELVRLREIQKQFETHAPDPRNYTAF